jgi:hypothetical protein
MAYACQLTLYALVTGLILFMPTILMKKLAGLPTLYCLQAISLIETFSLMAIWWIRLSCLLCSSADLINKNEFMVPMG